MSCLPRSLPLSEIEADEPAFPTLVDDYVAALSKGFKYPPIVCTRTADGYAVKDGHHRVAAARLLQRKFIQAYVR
jgi:ParB-like chromosome segregation protein Spo0J